MSVLLIAARDDLILLPYMAFFWVVSVTIIAIAFFLAFIGADEIWKRWRKRK